MAYTGYFQLYFLLVIMQFYLVFPLVLMLLRRTRGHHSLVIAATALAQVMIAIGMHWQILPSLMIRYGQRDALSYLLYLIGGGVVAFHLDEVHAWVCGHARLIMRANGSRSARRRGRLFPGPARRDHRAGIGQRPVPAQRHPVQRRRDHVRVPGRRCPGPAPAITADEGRGALGFRQRLRHLPVPDGFHHRAGLVGLGAPHLDDPRGRCCARQTVAIVFACGIMLTSVLARTPLAVPLTGRKQQPWSTLIPRRRAANLPAPGPGSPAFPDPAPAALAGVTSDQNGARQ